MERIPFTPEGLEKLKAKLNHMETVERIENIKAIEEARAHGDLRENAEYHAAKERQALIEAKIRELRDIVGRAEIIDSSSEKSDRVVFGKKITLYDINTGKKVIYQLVGPYESEPENGRISINSPLGRSLIGKEVGDEISVRTPSGVQEFEILEIY